MCGINGLLSNDESVKRKIPHLNKLLKHRGPDDEGFVFIDTKSGQFKEYSGDDSIDFIKKKYPDISFAEYSDYNLILAHRRLSIIDLSECGHGPMSNPSGKIWITYNGEIYNYIELREELESARYKFYTATDTEVIINSYLHWGYDCLNHFNGMWAFCIWDGIKKELFLARDRFGVKPLNYAFSENYFAFSSEIKPLIHLNPEDFEVNIKKIPFFLLHGNRLNSDETFIKNIHSLPASHFAIYKNGQLSIKKYYDINAIKDFKKNTEDDLQKMLIELLSDSIKIRFRSDVPVGTCLSGGFDSSSIVSLSSGLNKSNMLETFSAVWKDKDSDESKYIDIVNKKFHCIENKVEPKADEFETVFDKICYYQEIPTEGPGLYPQWYVMNKAKGKVKVLLDGQGGDEVFGGYFLKSSYLISILKDKNIAKLLKEFHKYSMFLNKNDFHSLSNWLFPKTYNNLVYKRVSERFKIFNKSLLSEINTKSLYADLDPPKKFKNYLNNLSYHFITNMTIPTLLHYEDRSSMAHSIESRVPFLDYRLVEFGINLSPKYLIKNDTSRPLFRKSIAPFLPKEIVNRKDKLGYPVPFAKWTRGVLKSYVTDNLLNTDSALFTILEKKVMKVNLDLHFAGKIDYSWDIWRLLSLKNFMENYKKLTIVY